MKDSDKRALLSIAFILLATLIGYVVDPSGSHIGALIGLMVGFLLVIYAEILALKPGMFS